MAVTLAGCSSGLQEVTVPASDRTVNAETDTIDVPVPEVPEYGVPTQPITLEVSMDTLPGPELAVKRLTVDRRTDDQHVAVQYETGGQTRTDRYQLPAVGEALDIRPQVQRSTTKGKRRGAPRGDSRPMPTVVTDTLRDTVTVAHVRGEPQERTLEAEVTDPQEGWWGLKNELAGLGLLTIAAGLAGVAWRFRSLLPIPM